MTFRPLAALIAAMLLPFAATSQDLEAEVVQNPDNTVTYTLDIQGPPQGAAFVFASQTLLAQPIQIPGVLFPCWLDPQLAINLALVNLDNQGQKQVNINVPIAVLQGVDIKAQCVVVDGANQLAFSPFVAGAQIVLPLFNLAVAWDYAAGAQRFRSNVKGRAGDQVRVTINGGQDGVGFVILDANGKGTVQIDNVNLKTGDVITYERNGVVVRSQKVD